MFVSDLGLLSIVILSLIMCIILAPDVRMILAL